MFSLWIFFLITIVTELRINKSLTEFDLESWYFDVWFTLWETMLFSHKLDSAVFHIDFLVVIQ